MGACYVKSLWAKDSMEIVGLAFVRVTIVLSRRHMYVGNCACGLCMKHNLVLSIQAGGKVCKSLVGERFDGNCWTRHGKSDKCDLKTSYI